MPSVSQAQQKMMAIAEHDPDKLYKKNRGVLKLSHDQLHDFAVGSMSGKPEHVSHHSPPEARPTPTISGLFGSSPDIISSNVSTLKQSGLSEADATRKAIQASRGFTNPKKPYRNQHKNLGKFLHPRKDGKPHGADRADEASELYPGNG